MKKKANLSGFGKFVLYSVISAIIFLTIYSFWFAPTMTGQVTYSFPERIKELADDIGDKIKSIDLDSSNETSDFRCEDEFKKEWKSMKPMLTRGSSLKMLEKKSFTDKQEILNYIDKNDIYFGYEVKDYIKEKWNGRLDVVLYRIETDVYVDLGESQRTVMMMVGICDGENLKI